MWVQEGVPTTNLALAKVFRYRAIEEIWIFVPGVERPTYKSVNIFLSTSIYPTTFYWNKNDGAVSRWFPKCCNLWSALTMNQFRLYTHKGKSAPARTANNGEQNMVVRLYALPPIMLVWDQREIGRIERIFPSGPPGLMTSSLIMWPGPTSSL